MKTETLKTAMGSLQPSTITHA